MLCIALNDTIAAAIDTYTKSHLDDLFEDYLSPQDWEQLRTIATFLKPFYRATLKTQGHNATLDEVLFTMDILVKWFEKGLVSNSLLKGGRGKNTNRRTMNRKFISLIKTSLLGLRRDGRSLTSITLRQIRPLYTPLLLSFTQMVVRSILDRTGLRDGLHLR
jgi:hypothetical protein